MKKLVTLSATILLAIFIMCQAPVDCQSMIEDAQCKKLDATIPAVTSLTVKITTGTGTGAGTNDKVYLNLGSGWEKELTNYPADDFAEGASDVFTFDSLTLNICHITQINIRKTETSGVQNDKWFFYGIEVSANGGQLLLYRNDMIATWLADDTNLTWTAPASGAGAYEYDKELCKCYLPKE